MDKIWGHIEDKHSAQTVRRMFYCYLLSCYIRV